MAKDKLVFSDEVLRHFGESLKVFPEIVESFKIVFEAASDESLKSYKVRYFGNLTGSTERMTFDSPVGKIAVLVKILRPSKLLELHFRFIRLELIDSPALGKEAAAPLWEFSVYSNYAASWSEKADTEWNLPRKGSVPSTVVIQRFAHELSSRLARSIPKNY